MSRTSVGAGVTIAAAALLVAARPAAAQVGVKHDSDDKAVKEAVRKAGPVLLEPIYEVTVTVPADNMGDVLGDMNSRRARVLGMDQEGSKSIVRAEVPLAEMQRYAADLRSMTQGRGLFSMKFLHYGRVAAHLLDDLVAKLMKERELAEAAEVH